MKDPTIDSELVYAYAKTDQGTAMEEFVSGTNTANVQAVGDRLYDEKNYKAAKVRAGGCLTLLDIVSMRGSDQSLLRS